MTTYFREGCFTEIKAENRVNPISGTSDSPRFIERVPAGAVFEGEIVLNVFKGDDKDKMMKTIKESLKLLELNYLGGNGTRGYGRVKVEMGNFEKEM
ncbi:type III-A CRISPR-associated RAMP protein Csm3 [Thomasclavelia cocleata]|uniref:type III-A CRISPR-associated RAMP protein Csm3 n=1 Tax=Thomasclavelia cocleata TaxID=69824 RepID=UPI000C280C9A|nr:type III-A CRISPR-associated RAMP protein Csm3 [Thomasclavelia cocleata]